MRKPFSIRPASVQDISQIRQIAADCGLENWTVGAYQDEIEREGGIALIGLNEIGTITGFIIGRVVPGVRESGFDAEIYNIGVVSASRRLGLATRLFARFRSICENRGVDNVWLEVRSSNDSAISFYTRHGFARSAVRKGFYRDPVEDADVMLLTVR